MHCTHYIISAKLWYWEVQHQTQDSWFLLTTADTRGRTDQLMTALLMPPWMLLSFPSQTCSAAWCSAWCPRSPSGGSSSCFQSALVHWLYFFPDVGFGITLCWTLRGPVHFSSLSRCLWEAGDPPIISSTSHTFQLCPSLAEMPLCPTTQVIDEDANSFSQ